MHIAFLWNFSKAKEIYPNWRDGHRAAIEEIGKRHQVDWYLAEECDNAPDLYDFLLFWTDASDPIVDKFINHKARKGILLTSDNGLPAKIGQYDVVYCESNEVLDRARPYIKRGIKAIGTDTNFYVPDNSVVKDIEYLSIGTFSPWKRQDLLVSLGSRLTIIGSVQPDGKDILRICQNSGINCITTYIPAEEIRNYYNRAQNVIISAIHGSERTVLESCSMNILPRVLPHNPKTESYIKEYIASDFLTPRDFVVTNYSHHIYAQQIERGIENG